MASEITVTMSLLALKGSVTATMSDSAKAYDMTGTKVLHNVQNVGFAAEEALGMGDITSPSWAYFRNLDATNFVEIRAATGESDLIKLKPGEHACFPLVATAPFVQADTAAVDLEYIITEE